MTVGTQGGQRLPGCLMGSFRNSLGRQRRGEAPRGSGWQCPHPAHATGPWRRRSSGCGVGGWGRSGFTVRRERLGGRGQQVAGGGKAAGYAGVWTQADFNRIVYTRWRKQRSLTVGQRAPKTGSTSLITREAQINPIVTCHLTPMRLVINNNNREPVLVRMWSLGTLRLGGGNTQGYHRHGKQKSDLSKS